MKRFLVLAMIAALLFAACDDKKDRVVTNHDPPSAYKDRTEKWHVLHNLQEAYNSMEAEPYINQLDENFIAFLLLGDPGSVPVQWFYDEEVSSIQAMLNKGGGISSNPVVSVDLELINIQDALWVEFAPLGEFPDETWFETTVAYDLTIDTANGTQFRTGRTHNARFTVRQQPDNKWKLVRWRDRDGGLIRVRRGDG